MVCRAQIRVVDLGEIEVVEVVVLEGDGTWIKIRCLMVWVEA